MLQLSCSLFVRALTFPIIYPGLSLFCLVFKLSNILLPNLANVLALKKFIQCIMQTMKYLCDLFQSLHVNKSVLLQISYYFFINIMWYVTKMQDQMTSLRITSPFLCGKFSVQ